MSTATHALGTRLRRPRTLAVGSALALLVAFAFAALRPSRVARGTRAARPDLQATLDRLVTGPAAIAPGATAFVAGPRGTWLGAAGVADVRTGAPLRPDARMRLESVSKIYTAALVVRLAEERRLRLDDTVERWLPGLLPYGAIMIRELLTMRSGLVDSNDLKTDPDRFLALVGDARLRAQLAALIRRATAHPATEISPLWWIRWAAWVPLRFPPGTRDHYSNIGYEVLGLIAARAGGTSLADLYRTRILAPLQLGATAYDPQGPIAGEHARGYLLAGGARTDASDAHAAIGASGGIVADARDTAAFLTGLMRGRLVDRRSLAGMRGDDLWLGGQPTLCAGPAYGWSGGGDGYKTNVWVDATGSRVAVLLLNGRVGGDGQAAGDQAAGAALAHLYCAA